MLINEIEFKDIKTSPHPYGNMIFVKKKSRNTHLNKKQYFQHTVLVKLN